MISIGYVGTRLAMYRSMNNKQTKTFFLSQLKQGILPAPKTAIEYAVYKKLKFGKQYGALFNKIEGGAV